MSTTRSTAKGSKGSAKGSAKVGTVGKAACAKVCKPGGSQPANVQQLAALVAQLPQGATYGSAAALFAAAAPQGYPRTLGTQGRHCLRAQGQYAPRPGGGQGRGGRHAGLTPAHWLGQYNATHANRQVHAS